MDNSKLDNNLNYKKKMIFFSAPRGDDYINDIIQAMGEEYITEKIIVTNMNQIDKGMNWADICWFEWCDELMVYGSNSIYANNKKIICRLHSYEAFTNYPRQVNWDNVDELIFVANHIKDIVTERIDIDNNKIKVIPNGIDINKFTFKERTKGFNIASVADISFKKGPMLLLHTFKAIFDRDNRYKLHIAGNFKEDRYIFYFSQLIKELRLQKNVIYHGFQNDINTWLEDKDYIISSSLLESQQLSLMEAMSKGIKPIIHNFVGAKTIYSEKYIWNSINEAVDMVTSDEYNSKDYREFVEINYSLNKQIFSIKELIKKLNS